MDSESQLLGLTAQQRRTYLMAPLSSVTITKVGQPIPLTTLAGSRLRLAQSQQVMPIYTSPSKPLNVSNLIQFGNTKTTTTTAPIIGRRTFLDTSNKFASFHETTPANKTLLSDQKLLGNGFAQQQQSTAAAVRNEIQANLHMKFATNRPHSSQRLSTEINAVSPSRSQLFSIITPQKKPNQRVEQLSGQQQSQSTSKQQQQQQEQQSINISKLADCSRTIRRNLSPQLSPSQLPHWRLSTSATKNQIQQSINLIGVSRCILMSPVTIKCDSPSQPQQQRTFLPTKRSFHTQSISNTSAILVQPNIANIQLNVPSSQGATPLNISQDHLQQQNILNNSYSVNLLRQFQQTVQPKQIIAQPHQLSASMLQLSHQKFILSTQENYSRQHSFAHSPQQSEQIPQYYQGSNGKNYGNHDLNAEKPLRSANSSKLEFLLRQSKPIASDEHSQVLPQNISAYRADDSQMQTGSVMMAVDNSSSQAPRKSQITFPDGSYYIGDVVQGKMEGLGEQFNSQGQLIYEGEWQGGLYHGRGVLRTDLAFEQADSCNKGNVEETDFKDFSNSEKLQTIYEGQFACGKKEGAGVQHFLDGSQFFGGFTSGIIQGAGAFTEKNSQKKITGIWADSKLEVNFE